MWCNFYSGFSTVVAIYIVTNQYPTDQQQVSDTCVLLCVFIHVSVESWYLCPIVQTVPKSSQLSAPCFFFKAFLRSVLNYCDTFNMEQTNIWYLLLLIYFYTRINFLLQFLFIILIEWFYFIMCPNQFFEWKWFKFKKNVLDHLITEIIRILQVFFLNLSILYMH